jgi:choline dehydrogenase
MSTRPDETDRAAAEFAERVRRNQQQLGSQLRPAYDFIVCGSGSSGSVVARRLAENPDVSVLLLEAGGDDDVPEVMRAEQWPLNLGSERDWNFTAEPNPHLNGRAIPYDMGKVLGGGSSINVMIWARGHKSDWLAPVKRRARQSVSSVSMARYSTSESRRLRMRRASMPPSQLFVRRSRSSRAGG